MREITRILKEYGYTQKALSEKLHIPQRTIENWASESSTNKRECPKYVLEMIEKILAIEKEKK